MGSLAESHPSMAVQARRRFRSSDAQHHGPVVVRVYFCENKNKIVYNDIKGGVTPLAESICYGTDLACNATV